MNNEQNNAPQNSDVNDNNPQNGSRKPVNKKALGRLGLLILNTVLFFSLYRVMLFYGERTNETFGAFVVMILYLVLLLGFTLAYLIYNRFFYKKGLTAEDLPAEWSEEQKTAFIEDGERRLQRSRWMMLIIFPLVCTFLFDAVDIFIIEEFFR